MSLLGTIGKMASSKIFEKWRTGLKRKRIASRPAVIAST